MSASMGEPQQQVGWIRLTLQGSVLTRSFVPPAVRLNGYRVPAGNGVSVHPVPPGRWRVEASSHWLREYGQAALDVDVAPGRCVEVFYAPPWHQFARGRMGTTPQPRPGAWVWLLFIALMAMMIGLLVLISVLQVAQT